MHKQRYPKTIEFRLIGRDFINDCWENTSHVDQRIRRRIALSDMYSKAEMDKAYVKLEQLTGLFRDDGMGIVQRMHPDKQPLAVTYTYNQVFNESILSTNALMNGCGNPACCNPFHHRKIDNITEEDYFHCKYLAPANSDLKEVREVLRRTDTRKITMEQVHELLDRKFIKKESNLTQICRDIGIRYQTAVKILKFQRYREFTWLFWAERGVYDADEYPQYGKQQMKPYRPRKEDTTKQEEVERLYEKLREMYGL